MGDSNGSGPRNDGADRETRPPKPCCARLSHGGWCELAIGHEGNCLGTPAAKHPPPGFAPNSKPKR